MVRVEQSLPEDLLTVVGCQLAGLGVAHGGQEKTVVHVERLGSIGVEDGLHIEGVERGGFDDFFALLEDFPEVVLEEEEVGRGVVAHKSSDIN